MTVLRGTRPMLTRYQCKNCKAIYGQWQGRCSHCAAMSVEKMRAEPVLEPGTLRASDAVPVDVAPERDITPSPMPRASAPTAAPAPIATARTGPVQVDDGDEDGPAPVRLCDVEETTYQRIKTGLTPFDDVLGGGIVPRSVVLIGAEPGSGKSTLLNQALAGTGAKCLYATGEETVAQAAQRARRIDADSRLVYMVQETRWEVIRKHALKLGVELVAIDSVQTLTCEHASGDPGSPGQVKACTNAIKDFAKDPNNPEISFLLISHVNGDSKISGPKTLEHFVDTVIYMDRGRNDYRLLRATKNRFGAISVTGRLIMGATGLEPTTFEFEVTPCDEDDEDRN